MATKPKSYNPEVKLTDSTTDFSGGINVSVSPDELKDNQFLAIENLDIDKVGQAVKRYGLKKFTVGGNGLELVVKQELQKQYKDLNINFATMLIKDSFIFFDGIRKVLNFTTDKGLVTIVFNELMNDIETMDDGTKLVLFYPLITEYVKFVQYNSYNLLYCTRPKTMRNAIVGPVKRDTYDERKQELFTVDEYEPVTCYIWNPTNRNKVKYDPNSITDPIYKDIQPIGWVQNFNFNQSVQPIPNFDGASLEAETLFSEKLTALPNEEYYIHTSTPFDSENELIKLGIDDKQYFVEPGGKFEYIRNLGVNDNHVWKYSSYKSSEVLIKISEVSVKAEDKFLNFPIVYANGYFYFGGCSEEKMYFLRISLEKLNQGSNDYEEWRIIDAKKIRFHHGLIEGIVGDSYTDIPNCFGLADIALTDLATPDVFGNSGHRWSRRQPPLFYTSFELLKKYKDINNDCYGKAIVFDDLNYERRSCYALPFYTTVHTTTGTFNHFKWRKLVGADLLYDVELKEHIFFSTRTTMFASDNLYSNYQDRLATFTNDSLVEKFIKENQDAPKNIIDDPNDEKAFYMFYKNDFIKEINYELLDTGISNSWSSVESETNGYDFYKFNTSKINTLYFRKQEPLPFNSPKGTTNNSSLKRIRLYSCFINNTITGYHMTDDKVYLSHWSDSGQESSNNTNDLNKKEVTGSIFIWNIWNRFYTRDEEIVSEDSIDTKHHYLKDRSMFSSIFTTRNKNISINVPFDNQIKNGVSIRDYYTIGSTKDDFQMLYQDIDLTFSHSNPIIPFTSNDLKTTVDKHNLIGHAVFHKLWKLNQKFNNSLWFGWSNENKINTTNARTIDSLVLNQRNQDNYVFNNPKLVLNKDWIKEVVNEYLPKATTDTIDVDEWYETIGKNLDIRLKTKRNPIGTGPILEAVDLSNFGFVYEVEAYLTTNIFNNKELNEFKNKLQNSSLSRFNVTINDRQFIGESVSNVTVNAFLNATQQELVLGNRRNLFRVINFGIKNNFYDFQCWYSLDGTNDWTVVFYNPNRMNQEGLNSINFENRSTYLWFMTTDTRINQTDNTIYFNPIREYIPTISDIKNGSYNLCTLDDRSKTLNNTDRTSDIRSHTDISRWLVREIEESHDATITDPNDATIYLNGILPVNTLTPRPLEDIKFKLYGYQDSDSNYRPELIYKWISMSADDYNNTFFNDDYDWKKWLETNNTTNLTTDIKRSDIIIKSTNVPYGDREWVIGWVMAKWGEKEVDGTPTMTIISDTSLSATYNFIPNTTDNDAMMTRSYGEFLHTNKATVFAGRVVLYGNCNKLFFSELNNPTYFPLFYTLELPTPEPIKSCVQFGYYLIISTNNSKYILRGKTFDNTSSSAFVLENISTDTGSITVEADKVNGNRLFYLDTVGIKYLANAYATAEKEYNQKDADRMIRNLLPDIYGKQDAIATTHNNRYYIHFPATKQMFVYYNELESWSMYSGDLFEFSKIFSDDGILYAISKYTMDIYYFDKDTYVDGWEGKYTTVWDTESFGPIWEDKTDDENMKLTHQVGIPITTSIITRPIKGNDEDIYKAYYDTVVNVKSKAPMNYLDIKVQLDNNEIIGTWSMNDGITKTGMLYTHYLEGSAQSLYYSRIFPQAILNQTSFANYSRLGNSEYNTHKIKLQGKKAKRLILGIRNTTPSSYSIENINVDYKYRRS